MRIRTESNGDRQRVELAGRFDAHEVPGFRAAVDPLVGTAAAKVHLDLSQVVFIDSSALAELVRAQKSARGHGGDLVLVALSDPVRIILELTALLGVFTVEAGPDRVVAGNVTVSTADAVRARHPMSPVDRAIDALLAAAGIDESAAGVPEAAAAIRDHVDGLTLAQHEITGALITAQDRLSILRTLTKVNVNALGRSEGEVQMLREAMALTDSDTVALVGPDAFQFAGRESDATELAATARSGRHDGNGPVPVVLDGSSVVLAALSGTSPSTVLAFARSAGPPFSTGDVQLIRAVVGALEMMHTLTRLHLEAVQRAAIEREHQAASTLAQAVLSTPPPDLADVQIFASSVPASLAGGDFMVFAVVDEVLWFAVGDVAGKGLPAAIVMTRAVSATRVAFLTTPPDDPAAALSAVGTELHDYLDDVGLFVTLALGTYHPPTRTLRLCNAGHSPVMTVRGGDVVPVPPSSPPLGVLATPVGRTVTLVLEPGDALVLGSDGLAEQQDPDGRMLGYEELVRLCRQGPADAPAMGRRILAAVAAHAAGTPASDDCTLAVLSAERTPR